MAKARATAIGGESGGMAARNKALRRLFDGECDMLWRRMTANRQARHQQRRGRRPISWHGVWRTVAQGEPVSINVVTSLS